MRRLKSMQKNTLQTQAAIFCLYDGQKNCFAKVFEEFHKQKRKLIRLLLQISRLQFYKIKILIRKKMRIETRATNNGRQPKNSAL